MRKHHKTVQPLVPSGLAQYVERNPPVIIIPVGRGIRKCKGCGEKVTDAEQSYPNNMVFPQNRNLGYILGTTEKWIQRKYNMHFHLKFSCVHKNDSTVEMKDIVMNDGFFQDLTHKQIEILERNEFLRHITAKKFL